MRVAASSRLVRSEEVVVLRFIRDSAFLRSGSPEANQGSRCQTADRRFNERFVAYRLSGILLQRKRRKITPKDVAVAVSRSRARYLIEFFLDARGFYRCFAEVGTIATIIPTA